MPSTALLVEHGADVNVQDNEGKTPLMGAAFYGGLGVVQYLRQHGARVDVVDSRGRTAASIALFAGNPDIAKFLTNQFE
jgi:ankyrin repeat protein